jgi:hypothetical protein
MIYPTNHEPEEHNRQPNRLPSKHELFAIRCQSIRYRKVWVGS